MQEKTKYTVLNKELMSKSRNIIGLLFYAISVSRKLESDKLSEEEKSIESAKAIKKFYPLMKAYAHLGYENAKDLKTLDDEVIEEYLEKKGISKETFINNYNKKLTETLQLLGLLALMEKENINIDELENINVIFDILDGEFNYDDIEENLKITSADLLDELCDDNFSCENVSDELYQLVEDYHNKYMQTEIYPKVTSFEQDQKAILKNAKSLTKKRKNSQ